MTVLESNDFFFKNIFKYTILSNTSAVSSIKSIVSNGFRQSLPWTISGIVNV